MTVQKCKENAFFGSAVEEALLDFLQLELQMPENSKKLKF